MCVCVCVCVCVYTDVYMCIDMNVDLRDPDRNSKNELIRKKERESVFVFIGDRPFLPEFLVIVFDWFLLLESFSHHR